MTAPIGPCGLLLNALSIARLNGTSEMMCLFGIGTLTCGRGEDSVIEKACRPRRLGVGRTLAWQLKCVMVVVVQSFRPAGLLGDSLWTPLRSDIDPMAGVPLVAPPVLLTKMPWVLVLNLRP